MRCYVFVSMLLLCSVLFAQETILRSARNIEWGGKHVRTTDNCELVFWEDTLENDYDIWVQKINPSGQLQWPTAIPVVQREGRQKLLDVVASSDNNYILLWESGLANSSHGLWVQKITGNGQRLWPEGGIEISPHDNYYHRTQLVPNALGGAMILFRDDNYLMGQNLDAWGNQLWQAGGQVIYFSSQYMIIDTAIPDGSGGAIVDLNVAQSGSRLMRISANGTIVGNNPLIPASAFPTADYSIMTGYNGEIIVHNANEPNEMLRLQKINANGELLLPAAVNTYLSTGESWSGYTSLIPVPDGGAYVTQYYAVQEGESAIEYMRFDPSFVPMWTSPSFLFGVGGEESIGRTSYSVNPGGGFSAAWLVDNHLLGTSSVVATYMNPEGEHVWQTGLITLNQTDRRVHDPLSISFNDRGMFVWLDIEGDQRSLRRQVISNGGSIYLGQEQEPIVSTTDGYAFGHITVALENGYFGAWLDNRSGNYQVYYQLLDNNMNAILETDGRRLTDQPGDESYISAIALPNNSIALIYTIGLETNLQRYLQIINSSGITQFPGRGLAISDPEYTAENHFMSVYEGDLYIGWSEQQTSNRMIKAQRISGGQKIWGEYGRTIVEYSNLHTANMLAVDGRYFSWVHSDYSTIDYSKIKTILLNSEGYPATGWPSEGINVLLSDPLQPQEYRASGLQDNDLVILMGIYGMETSLIRAQKISESGQRMWQDQGAFLVPEDNSNWIIDAVIGDRIAYLISEGDPQDMYLQMLSEEGTRLLPGMGTLIGENLGNMEAELTIYDSGYMACVWSDNSLDPSGWHDLYMRDIAPQGELMQTQAIVLSDAPYGQRSISLASRGERAMIAWSDERAGAYDLENFLSSIRACRISSGALENVEETILPLSPVVLHQNYPNPFNPETVISFDLTQESEIDLQIYNTKGQLVRNLLSDSPMSAGNHSLMWDGTDALGRKVCSGIYLYKLACGKQSEIRKMILMK